ncbi:carboxypeptidase-like regulatory domain-containing protein [Rubrivirga litoralis]|uniref:Carboxypeptidase-like regulatory domain-containing protein n=1 Tax=Rubrivirga litoralis TaxID=3075598 RepID=A0ABU3BSC9_9BACT|nr:carboxypeptidase-like regulatory domain-containing protein [Rubrivirga sp. F394]MDT0632203.1 carboxypeptidase-like regulatory domain-containing protein [Rubrivirga sp. F394]
MRPVFLAALVALVAGAAAAQPVRLEATVVDAETGAPLAGATAQVAGQEGGASADRDGRLSLALPAPPDTVVVRFVGYATAQVVVTADEAAAARAEGAGRQDANRQDANPRGGAVRRTIRLSPAPFVLGEVTVTDEPPGERLWRRLLARRQSLAARLGQYGAEAYGRLLLTRDGPTDVRPFPFALTETLSNLSWGRGGGLREEVVARRRLPEGGPFEWARMNPVPDLYFEDALALDGRSIPSITRPDALRYYAFRLGETVEADGRRYLDLAVIPRRGGLVAGRVRVVDTLLVIAEADLRLDAARTAAPVDALDASYRWRYEPADAGGALGDSAWLPRRFEREGAVTVRVPGTRVPTVRFQQTSVLDLVLPGAPGEAADLRRRYRSPRGVYTGAGVYRAGRRALPLDSLEVAVDTSDRVRRSTLAELLRPQEGIGFGGIFAGVSRLLGAGFDVEGDDDG